MAVRFKPPRDLQRSNEESFCSSALNRMKSNQLHWERPLSTGPQIKAAGGKVQPVQEIKFMLCDCATLQPLQLETR